MKKKLFSFVAVLLCIVLLSGCVSPFFKPAPVPPTEEDQAPLPRRTIPYDQMEYVRPDIDALKLLLTDSIDAFNNAQTFEEVMAIDDAITAAIESFSTMRTLAQLHTNQDVNDPFYDAEYRLLSEEGVELSLLLNDYNRALLNSRWANAYREEIGEYSYKLLENSLLLNSESVQEYKKERTALEADYDQMIASLTVTLDGTDYTLEDIYNIDSSTLYYQAMDAYYDAHLSSYTELYARMIELDKLTAYTLGFLSAADMYYLAYDRDYTPQQAQQLCDASKEYFVPFVPLVLEIHNRYNYSSPTLEETLDELPDMLNELDPELQEAWSFMLEYGLHDFGARSGKSASSQYTIEIDDYDAPFIFSYWRDDFNSATTLIHEFGHFYDFWLHYDGDTGNLDIAEVYSQGLELLMFPQYDELTDDPEAAELDQLQSTLLNTLVYQCALEEFQFRVYELDSFNADIIGQLYDEVMAEYGLSAGSGIDNRWIGVPHLFSAPFYTISYVTSAVAALQIWAVSENDYDEGVELYMELIHADQEQSFTQLIESAGLDPVHDTAMLRKIARQYQAVFNAHLLPAA